jgi:cell division septal protein FtsQ
MVKVKKQKIRVRIKKEKTPIILKFSTRFKSAAKFLTLILILGAAGLGLIRLKYMFEDSGRFIVKEINTELSDENGIVKNISLKDSLIKKIMGTNIFFVDLNGLKENIEAAHPEYKDLMVRRLLPDKLVVKGNLREALAQIRSDRYYFVDKDGVLLPEVKNFPDHDLPIIVGVGVNLAKLSSFKFSEFEKENLTKALDLIGEARSIEKLAGYKLKIIDITDPGNATFSLENSNVEIKIGNSNFHDRLVTLSTVLEQIGTDITKFKYIDLRFEDPIIGPS